MNKPVKPKKPKKSKTLKKSSTNLKWTYKLPNKKGYYWWIDDTMDIPEILYVKLCEDTVPPYMFASNIEYDFIITKNNSQKWCYIPEPI